jgi:hypothetical protein
MSLHSLPGQGRPLHSDWRGLGWLVSKSEPGQQAAALHLTPTAQPGPGEIPRLVGVCFRR